MFVLIEKASKLMFGAHTKILYVASPITSNNHSIVVFVDVRLLSSDIVPTAKGRNNIRKMPSCTTIE